MLGKIREWHEGVNNKDISTYFKRTISQLLPKTVLKTKHCLKVHTRRQGEYTIQAEEKNTCAHIQSLAILLWVSIMLLCISNYIMLSADCANTGVKILCKHVRMEKPPGRGVQESKPGDGESTCLDFRALAYFTYFASSEGNSASSPVPWLNYISLI